jgi:hypothetical protein
MDDDVRRRFVAAMTAARQDVQRTPGFMQDQELKGFYVILAAAEAALMFNEVESLAQLCAEWAGDNADRVAEMN